MSTLICPNCAWEHLATALRCVHCNCKLGAVTPKSQSPVASQNISPKIMEAIYCSSCGQHIAKEAAFCPGCGQPNKAMQGDQYIGGDSLTGVPVKSRIAAGLLALFVGGFGVHKFYCGQVGLGVIYLLFFWTFIPAIIAFIEGIIYLTSPNDHVFTKRYCQ